MTHMAITTGFISLPDGSEIYVRAGESVSSNSEMVEAAPTLFDNVVYDHVDPLLAPEPDPEPEAAPSPKSSKHAAEQDEAE
jgi:hypothetical protein